MNRNLNLTLRLVFATFILSLLIYILKNDSKKKEEILVRPTYTYDTFLKTRLLGENLGKFDSPKYADDAPICLLNMDKYGPIQAKKEEINLNALQSLFPKVRPGGYFAPGNCKARHKVAILVPYRDRQTNLAIFLRHMHPFLMKQQIEYRIFVIEQYGKDNFNKGALYNIGFLESQRYGSFDCYVFHDVDLLPLDERILYSCTRNPTHMSTAVESMGYKLPNRRMFGGVTTLRPVHFEKANGYSNQYWGWGAEDDDMFLRLQSRHFHVLRYNLSIARYATLPHTHANLNNLRYKLLRTAKTRSWNEGLRTVRYRLFGRFKRKLFVLFLIDVSPLKNENTMPNIPVE